jgi:TolB protein
VFVCVAVLPVLAAPAQAAFPGDNGKIVVLTVRHYYGGDLATFNPDGTGYQFIYFVGQADFFSPYPEWSPNGSKIAFLQYSPDSATYDVATVNPDGSGFTFVTNTPGIWEDGVTWSPDGTKLAVSTEAYSLSGPPGPPGIWVLNSDGTGMTQIRTTGGLPAWSPDGDRIAFVEEGFPNDTEIYTMKPDGTDVVQLTNNSSHDLYPNWSPDGSRLAFASLRDEPNPSGCGPCNWEIYTMNPDGSGTTRLTNNPAQDSEPAWSPDGTKIAFSSFRVSNDEGYIFKMNTDGSGVTQVTFPHEDDLYPPADITPDWQPLRPPGYARPKSATPATVRLVPAQVPCASANSTHGAPLAVPSCNPPQQTSNYLTVGTPDANGAAAKSTGLLTAKAVGESPIDPNNGDQSDIAFTVSITDVRNKNNLLDYSGELRVAFNLRLTDRLSGPGLIHPATSADTTFAFSFPCSQTLADPNVGSTCSTSSSADAVMPGITPEFTRAIWELGQVKVYDGGSDGDADTTGDNTLFMTQGLFAP